MSALCKAIVNPLKSLPLAQSLSGQNTVRCFLIYKKMDVQSGE